MTDYELNKAIAEALGYSVTDVKLSDISMDTVIKVGSLIAGPLPNYCRHWAILMPLVTKHKISVLSVSDEWMATVGNFTTPRYKHPLSKDPQRALAECLLKVLTNK